MNNEQTLISIFNGDPIELIKGFIIYHKTYPFKSITITPRSQDSKGLLTFDIYDSYLCGMRYTSFATGYLYSTRFYADTSIEQVISWINSVLDDLLKSIQSTKQTNDKSLS